MAYASGLMRAVLWVLKIPGERIHRASAWEPGIRQRVGRYDCYHRRYRIQSSYTFTPTTAESTPASVIILVRSVCPPPLFECFGTFINYFYLI